MTSYRVSWEIDIEADSPQEAAVEALRIQRNTDSWATCFVVSDPTGVTTVDLMLPNIKEAWRKGLQ